MFVFLSNSSWCWAVFHRFLQFQVFSLILGQDANRVSSFSHKCGFLHALNTYNKATVLLVVPGKCKCETIPAVMVQNLHSDQNCSLAVHARITAADPSYRSRSQPLSTNYWYHLHHYHHHDHNHYYHNQYHHHHHYHSIVLEE